MQKIIFQLPQTLVERMDEAIAKWGFLSRSEFLRFTAIDFLRKDGQLMPADIILKEHSRAIRSVKTNKDLAEIRKEWYRPTKETKPQL